MVEQVVGRPTMSNSDVVDKHNEIGIITFEAYIIHSKVRFSFAISKKAKNRNVKPLLGEGGNG